MSKTFVKTAACALTIALFAAVAAPFAACGKPKTLAETYKDYFKIGAALNVNPDSGSLGYEDEILREFNSFTAGNEMKWKYTENTKGNFTFELGDALVAKAKSLKNAVRGHALVWRSSTPDYVVRDGKNADPAVAKATVIEDIKEHISATVSHYGHDVVYCWDVVNEAISDSSNPADIYYDCPLYEAAGEDYIFEAFKAAKLADSKVKLFYNDYNLNNPVKRAKAISMIKKMRAEGVPIDGIGEQAHYSIRNFDFEGFQDMLDDFRELDLEVQITELDFSIYESDGDAQFDGLSAETEALQAEAYGKLMQICRDNKDIISGVTFWGVGDDNTWLDDFPVKGRKNYPLLYDVFTEKKAAYDAVMNVKNQYVFDKDKKSDASYNVCDGKSSEFSFGKWYGDFENSGFEITDNYSVGGENATRVHYAKLSEYTQAQCNIHGSMERYKYINFSLSGSKTMLVMPQMNYYLGYGEENDKIIGEETMEITTEKHTYSIRIPDSKRIYMDVMDEVWLFPEPGDRTGDDGKLLTGDIYIYDSWFSDEAPSGATVFEPSGSGNGVSEKAYKKSGQSTWYNETSWTKYKMKLSGSGLVDISSTGAATWGFVSVQLDGFKTDDNKLVFSYIDNSSDKCSVEYMRFRLRGTPTGMTDDGINTYMTYYDKDLVDWVYDDASYVQPAAGGPESVTIDKKTGRVDVVYDISKEVAYMLDRGAIDLSDDGYGLRLVILIETVGKDGKTGKDYSPLYPSNYSDETLRGKTVSADKKFNITVLEAKTEKR